MILTDYKNTLPPTAIQFEGISKRYANGVQALVDVSLSIPQGSFFALLGSNGAGKSTLLGMLSSLVTPSSGHIFVMGQPFTQNAWAIKKQIGVVPQEFNFYMFDTVEDIVRNQAGYYGVAADAAKQETAYYLKRLSLWEHRHKTARSLSGGMKRRLMIARALVHRPKILLLDEPSAGVDVELRYDMWDFVRQLNAEGITILLTTHYLEEIERLCQEMAILDQGKIIYQNSLAQIAGSLEALYLEKTQRKQMSSSYREEI